MLRAAADAEAQLPAPLGLPAPIKPAPELLGEILLEAGRPAEAIASFETALRRNANRSLSVLGIARAAAASGQADASRRRYTELLANFDGADADLPALREARVAIVATTPTSAPASAMRSRLVVAIVALTILAAIVASVFARTRKRGPVARAPRKAAAKRRR